MRYFAVAIFIFLAGCNYSKQKTGAGSSKTVSKSQIENPDYQTVLTVVIGPKCLNCHSTARGNQGSTNLEGFETVKGKLNRILYRSLEARDMPPKNPLNEMELAVLSKWADNGAPDKVIGGGEKPATDLERGPANWAKVRDGIFKAKCMDCHQQPNPEAGLDLANMAMVREKIGVIVDRTFGRADMPLAPYPSLTPVETRVFFKWLANGMPQ